MPIILQVAATLALLVIRLILSLALLALLQAAFNAFAHRVVTSFTDCSTHQGLAALPPSCH
jgi:hypothetical protein